MTFQRWARLLIDLLKEDDFIVSTVKADVEAESVCKLEPFKTYYLQVYYQNNVQNCYHLIHKTLHWQVKYNQADLSIKWSA